MSTFDQREQHVTNQINIAISASSAARGAPFVVSRVSDLPAALPNFPNADIQYVARSHGTRALYDAEIVNRRLILTGRTGLGKTREAIELIARLESKYGETFTIVLISRFVPTRELHLPGPIPTRNVVLLLDDIHLLNTRYAEFRADTDTGEEFSSWIASAIDYLERLSAGRLWVIGTLRDEPGVAPESLLSHSTWSNFVFEKLDPISPHVLPRAVEVVANSFGIIVDPSAHPTFTTRCDGTFMSLVAYFRTKASSGVTFVDAAQASDFIGSYPLFWRTEYAALIEPSPTFSAVFRSLSILRELGITVAPHGAGVRLLVASRAAGLVWVGGHAASERPKTAVARGRT